jgi:toxin ParE1/3/4
MPLRFAPLAVRDLESIGEYIAADNPRRAMTFVQEIRRHCRGISQNPLAYRARPELGGATRSCVHGNYVLFFDVTDGEVVILRVLHGARDLNSGLFHGERAEPVKPLAGPSEG